MVEQPDGDDRINSEGPQLLQAAIRHLTEYQRVARPMNQAGPCYMDESYAVETLRRELMVVQDSLERRIEHGKDYEYDERVGEILERSQKDEEE